MRSQIGAGGMKRRSPKAPTRVIVDWPAVWEPGDTVVLRYLSRGRPVGAVPARAVATDRAVALWLAAGTRTAWAGVGARHIRDVPLEERFTRRWNPVDYAWQGDGVLILEAPGRAHSIWHFRDDGRFAGWYVNLEAVWRQFAFGFDTEDHVLDVWVGRDGTWRWKDEDELAVALESGFLTAEEAGAIRAEGERVVAEWPFPTGWEEWEPDPSWTIPTLPAGWDA
jgi:hypothetical protein